MIRKLFLLVAIEPRSIGMRNVRKLMLLAARAMAASRNRLRARRIDALRICGVTTTGKRTVGP